MLRGVTAQRLLPLMHEGLTAHRRAVAFVQQTPEAQQPQREPPATPSSTRPQDSARAMHHDEWQAAMGIESPPLRSTGPCTRQAAKRQRMAAQCR